MKKLAIFLIAILLCTTCVSNPMTGKSTMAFIGNSTLFPMSFAQYEEILSQSDVVTGTADAIMVERVGRKIAAAAERWLAAEGNAHYLKDYAWEYKLLNDKTINAWCLPGGKIGVYTGILPVTANEDGLAALLGHEVSHALLNHGQQRMSAGLLQQLGMIGLQVGMELAGASNEAQVLTMVAFGLGAQYGITLPFSRSNESEADRYGLFLMAIAGYNPDNATGLWERMTTMAGNSVPEFLSTHPSHSTRIRQLKDWAPEAKRKAAELGVGYY